MVCWCSVGIGAALLALYYGLRYLLELITVSNLKKKGIFVTGCDSGFGREFVIHCAKRGLVVFAGCLTEKGKKALEDDTKNLSGIVEAFLLDVTKEDSVETAKNFIESKLVNGLELWAVVNNAGIMPVYGPADWSVVDDFKEVLEVNTFGVIRVTLAFLPLLKASKGRLVTTTSVLSRVTLSGDAPYQCSKYATAGFLDTLRQELRPFGVKSSIIEPEIFETPLIAIPPMKEKIEFAWNRLSADKQEEYGEEFKNYWLSFFPEKVHQYKSKRIDYVIDNYYHAVTALFPRTRYYCGWGAIFIYTPLSLLPTEVHDFINRRLLNQKKFPAATVCKAKQQ